MLGSHFAHIKQSENLSHVSVIYNLNSAFFLLDLQGTEPEGRILSTLGSNKNVAFTFDHTATKTWALIVKGMTGSSGR